MPSCEMSVNDFKFNDLTRQILVLLLAQADPMYGTEKTI